MPTIETDIANNLRATLERTRTSDERRADNIRALEDIQRRLKAGEITEAQARRLGNAIE